MTKSKCSDKSRTRIQGLKSENYKNANVKWLTYLLLRVPQPACGGGGGDGDGGGGATA